MNNSPEELVLHAVPHPTPQVRRLGFPLDHPYVEQCWAPALGPSSVLLLRHFVSLWRDAVPARIATEELGRQVGLGRGTGRHSPLNHTIERLVRFRFAAVSSPGDLDVFTEAPPVPARLLDRLSSWSRARHEQLLGDHLDGLARNAGMTPLPADSASHVRMTEHLKRFTNHAAKAPSLGQ